MLDYKREKMRVVNENEKKREQRETLCGERRPRGLRPARKEVTWGEKAPRCAPGQIRSGRMDGMGWREGGSRREPTVGRADRIQAEGGRRTVSRCRCRAHADQPKRQAATPSQPTTKDANTAKERGAGGGRREGGGGEGGGGEGGERSGGGGSRRSRCCCAAAVRSII